MTYKPLKMDDKIHLGKYKGYSVSYLIGYDPKYLKWAIENIRGIFWDPSILKALRKEGYKHIKLPSYKKA